MYIETQGGEIVHLERLSIAADINWGTEGFMFAYTVAKETGRYRLYNKSMALGVYSGLDVARQEYKNIKEAIQRGDKLYTIN